MYRQDGRAGVAGTPASSSLKYYILGAALFQLFSEPMYLYTTAPMTAPTMGATQNSHN